MYRCAFIDLFNFGSVGCSRTKGKVVYMSTACSCLFLVGPITNSTKVYLSIVEHLNHSRPRDLIQ